MARQNILVDKWDEIKAFYLKGHSGNATAREFGFCSHTISAKLKEHGLFRSQDERTEVNRMTRERFEKVRIGKHSKNGFFKK